MDEKLIKDINNIVWWIPLKKLRNSVRNILIENFTYADKNISNIREDNVICPICGWSGEKFLPFGVITRYNALCPKCYSLERHRLYYLYLLNKINANKKLKVCHFAPEKSIKDTFNIFKNIEYVSCDIVPERAMYIQDITNITFDDNSFDIIFCSRVLEHIENDKKAMRELRRILNPNGFAILQVPIYTKNLYGEDLETTYENFSITSPEEREKEFGQFDHVRLYEKKDYIKRLKDSGFKVYEDNFSYNLSNESIKKYSIIKEPIFYCTKN